MHMLLADFDLCQALSVTSVTYSSIWVKFNNEEATGAMGEEDGVTDSFGPQNSHQAAHNQLPPAWHGYNHYNSSVPLLESKYPTQAQAYFRACL